MWRRHQGIYEAGSYRPYISGVYAEGRLGGYNTFTNRLLLLYITSLRITFFSKYLT